MNKKSLTEVNHITKKKQKTSGWFSLTHKAVELARDDWRPKKTTFNNLNG